MLKKYNIPPKAVGREMTLLGYVVGIIYRVDGCEWLRNTKGLCSLNPNRKESNPTIYKTEDEARAYMEKWETTMGEKFVRPYYHERFIFTK